MLTLGRRLVEQELAAGVSRGPPRGVAVDMLFPAKWKHYDRSMTSRIVCVEGEQGLARGQQQASRAGRDTGRSGTQADAEGLRCA